MSLTRRAWFRSRGVLETVRRPVVRLARGAVSAVRGLKRAAARGLKGARKRQGPRLKRWRQSVRVARKRGRDAFRPVSRFGRLLHKRTVYPVNRYARKYAWWTWKRIRKTYRWLVNAYLTALDAYVRALVAFIVRVDRVAGQALPVRAAAAVTRATALVIQALLPPRALIKQRLTMYGDVRGIHLKEAGRPYEHSFKGPWGRLRYQLALEEGQRKKRQMWAAYTRLSYDVALDVPYVYVALHFQPERTTSSLGGVFGDQYLVVDMLARSVPPGWKVYVKEHPSQFYPPFAGERSRHGDLYLDLLDLPNVELVSLTTSTFQLIDHAQAVATVTGTVGWEAVIRGKPALIFGSAWYRFCDGVFFVPTELMLRDALARIQAGFRPNPRRVRLYMQALDQTCARAGLGYNTPDESELDLPLDESVKRLTAVLQDYWSHMQVHVPASGVSDHQRPLYAGKP